MQYRKCLIKLPKIVHRSRLKLALMNAQRANASVLISRYSPGSTGTLSSIDAAMHEKSYGAKKKSKSIQSKKKKKKRRNFVSLSFSGVSLLL
jgi:hypothetical protein